MKRISAMMAMLFMLSFNLLALEKIVMIDETRSAKMTYAEIEKLGGKVIRELSLINALVVDFPDYVKDAQIYSLGFVRHVEDDRYIKWIEEITYPEIPSTKMIRKAIKDGEYDYDLPKVVSAIDRDKLTQEELAEIPWGVRRVGAHNAWSFTTGKGVDVAVLDTGIDYTHPDLAPVYKGGYNAIDESKPPLDDHGHGTHVAGTIGAVKDLKGVVGVAPEVNLYAVKALDSNGSGKYSWVVAGIEWAVKNNMKVINMSLGSRYSSDALKEAVRKAYEAGVVIVCAAGNDGGAVNYPAAYPQTIAVSASNSSDKIAYFSSRGKEIDFIAPGVSIYSTYKGGGYKTLSGTSMAAPHVSGLAALAIALGISAPAEVFEALKNAATKLPGLKDTEQGYGMIDAAKLKR